MNYSSILVTDLDGTLTNSQHQISDQSLKTLRELGEQGVLRVIATGRNLFSARKMLTANLPFDYLIFSGGVGILDWKGGELLFSSQLSLTDTQAVTVYLKKERRDFMIQAPLPENHLFEYWQGGRENPDFNRRCELYSGYCRPWEEKDIPQASQIISVEPAETGPQSYEIVRGAFPHLSVVRTTSPLDNASVWIEISHSGVSKASATQWLCSRFSIPHAATVGVGNDYNDRDLLDWVKQPFVVDNCPSELKKTYRIVSSHDAEGFSEAVQQALPKLGKP